MLLNDNNLSVDVIGQFAAPKSLRLGGTSQAESRHVGQYDLIGSVAANRNHAVRNGLAGIVTSDNLVALLDDQPTEPRLMLLLLSRVGQLL